MAPPRRFVCHDRGVSKTYAVIYSYTSDSELREKTRQVHRDYLSSLADGTLLAAGAWAPAEDPGGLLIFRSADRAGVQAIVDEDPYTKAGVVATVDIREWAPPLGPVSDALNGKGSAGS